MSLLIPIILAIAFLLCWAWVKLINMIFNPIIKRLDNKAKDIRDPYRHNPYVQSHRLRLYNDHQYDQYIEWMDKNNHGLPVDKVLTPEEIRFKKQLEEERKRPKWRR